MARKNPAAVALGRRGGKVKSAAKAAAVRENGKKGGRPARVPVAPSAVTPNPHPHRMVGKVEVTMWPDGLVGVAIPGTVVNFLLTPYLAHQLSVALAELASSARPRSGACLSRLNAERP